MKNLLVSFCLILAFSPLIAQQTNYFSDPVESFSKKKIAYITIEDGTEISGKIKKLKRKRGLFEEIILEMENEATKSIAADDIAHMYLPQSGWDKMGKWAEWQNDVQKWKGENQINQEHLKDGYAYFEKSNVFYKKNKEQTLLLQLLNPAFANKVRVYHDPYAAETGTTSVGGFKMAGGNDKSFFVKKGEETAFKLTKKDYDKKAEMLYGDCKAVLKKVMDDMKWKNFGAQLFEYSGACLE